MHELSIAQSIVDTVKDELKRYKATKVFALEIEIGVFSGVVSECLEFVFPEVVKNTLLEKAKVSFVKIPLEIECKSCTTKSIHDEISIICPLCDSTNVLVIKGKELKISKMEMA